MTSKARAADDALVRRLQEECDENERAKDSVRTIRDRLRTIHERIAVVTLETAVTGRVRDVDPPDAGRK
jgi:hypothetical protein